MEKKLVTLYSVVYETTEFIELQLKSFNHFLNDPWKLIIINNGKDENIKKQIKERSDELGLLSFIPEN